MKERIFTNWNFTRVIYLILGLVVVVQSVYNAQWYGVLFGVYFASMGIFAFGCAGGNCFSGNCQTEPKNVPFNNQKIKFEEINSK